jgi:hypothetical protein
MSRYQGGLIGSVANTPSGTAYTGRANGVFPLPQQIVAKSSSLWAIGQTVPNAPTIGTATAASATSISVAFIPPVQNGGSTITSYTVTSSGGQTATGASSPIVVSGLTTGTSYTFTVTATNALGTSISSGTSNSATPAITDPYFSSVVLLLNGDTITDLSSIPRPITNSGSVSINTSNKKYGTGSMSFNGSSQALLIAATPQFNFSTNNFTIECWFNQTSKLSSYPCLINFNGPWGSGVFEFQVNTNDVGNKVCFSINNGGGNILTSTTNPTFGTWYHAAVVKDGSTLRLFVNGIQEASATYTNDINLSMNTTANVGGISDKYFNGYIDDLRITKGIARYTSNFTPPTAPLPTS